MSYPNNLKIVESPKDGNCFFHCFELYFDNINLNHKTKINPYNHILLRKKIVEFIIKSTFWQKKIKSQFGIENLENELEVLQNNGEFNFDLFDVIPFIMSKYLKINIIIYPQKIEYLQSSYKNTIYLYYQNEHYDLLIEKNQNDYIIEKEKKEEIKIENIMDKMIKLENLIKEKNKIVFETHNQELQREKQKKEHENKIKKLEHFINKQLQINPETLDTETEKKKLLLHQHNLGFVKSLISEKLF